MPEAGMLPDRALERDDARCMGSGPPGEAVIGRAPEGAVRKASGEGEGMGMLGGADCAAMLMPCIGAGPLPGAGTDPVVGEASAEEGRTVRAPRASEGVGGSGSPSA